VHYTLDGTDATPASPVFRDPVKITDTTTVKAITIWKDGRISEPTVAKLQKTAYLEPTDVQGLEAGMTYESYDWKGSALPDFTTQTSLKSGIVQAFDPEPVQPHDDYYALRFTGYVRIPRDGVYTFTTGSDDGSDMWVGGQEVVNNDGLHAYTEKLGDVALKAGYYPFTVAFFQADGAKYLRVFWEGPGIKKQRIPASALFHTR